MTTQSQAGAPAGLHGLASARAWAAGALVVVGALAFAAVQASLWGKNGYWNDEYFSMWASDPSLPFTTLFVQRILPDTNPPLYFSALALLRPAIESPRAAFLALNVLAIALACGYVLHDARRRNLNLAGAGCVAAFLTSGAVACYAPEGRAYLMAMCVVFAASWATAAAVEGREEKGAVLWLVLGGLAALSHVFAALFVGSLAAALAAHGLLGKRRDLLRAGLLMGGTASVIFAVWLAFIFPRMANISWIEFTPRAVLVAAWYVKELTAGSNIVLLTLGGFLTWSATLPAVRPHLRVFGLGAALFVLLPLLASFQAPLIVGRYWLVGAPALVVLVVLTIRTHILEGAGEGPLGLTRTAAGAAALGVLGLIGASVFGVANAHVLTAQKPVWRGVELARDLLKSCPAGAVHVAADTGLYAIASGVPVEVFVNAGGAATPLVEARSAPCPIVGWAEHVRIPAGLEQTKDAELLSMLKITGEAGVDARVVRHSSGYIVLRADAPAQRASADVR